MSPTGYEVIMSGKASFKIEVPHQLIENGESGAKKPLIVYLHGYGQNLETFKQLNEPLLSLNAYHLFLQGPYPLYDRTHKKNVSKWGRAWYLFDGNRGQFIKSLEVTSEFIQEIIDRLLTVIEVSKICVIGFSMGGYLAGYFGLTRWKHVHEVIMSGARLKTEVLNGDFESIRHITFLAIHGKEDDSVASAPQKKEMDVLKENGLDARFQQIDGGHSYDKLHVQTIKEWLQQRGY
ncbi:MAG: alpha/beta hydrolase [Balneolaceae bacterium]